MTIKLATLVDQLHQLLTSEERVSVVVVNNEVTIEIRPVHWRAVAYKLRDQFQFESCIDVCGVDYSTYQKDARTDSSLRNASSQNHRFAVVYHLLSLANNIRLRVRVYCLDDSAPVIESVLAVWPGVNWFEREAFDLFGIVFEGHPDLRRILTDYDFVGYPFRKDFPISGHVEMVYDEKAGRVIYQPVTIMPREVMPRCYPQGKE